jgi:hypothetical protein
MSVGIERATELISEGLWVTRSGDKAEVFFSDEFGWVGRVGFVAVDWFPCGENCDGVSELDIVGRWEDRVEDYRPYLPGERHNLRGRWFRFRVDNGTERMVDDLQVLGDELFINGWSAQDFLANCVWLDGGMCGKPAIAGSDVEMQFDEDAAL